MKKQLQFHFPNNLKTYFFLILASVISVFVIDIFLNISEFAQHYFKQINKTYPWLTFIITPLGFTMIIWFAKTKCHFVQSSGIPQVIAAMDSRHKKNSHSIIVF